uniref:BHLH domain-containing protein n=1 Tax=Heterorhabditis bacteriophora TaxID=37862 RepID=A0A1I7WTX1_HETBA
MASKAKKPMATMNSLFMELPMMNRSKSVKPSSASIHKSSRRLRRLLSTDLGKPETDRLATSPASTLRDKLKRAERNVHYIAQTLTDRRKVDEADWQFISLVVDRALLMIFTSCITVGTLFTARKTTNLHPVTAPSTNTLLLLSSSLSLQTTHTLFTPLNESNNMSEAGCMFIILFSHLNASFDQLGSELENYCTVADQRQHVHTEYAQPRQMNGGGMSGLNDQVGVPVSLQNGVRIRSESSSRPPPPTRRSSTITAATPTAPSIAEARMIVILMQFFFRQSLNSSSTYNGPLGSNSDLRYSNMAIIGDVKGNISIPITSQEVTSPGKTTSVNEDNSWIRYAILSLTIICLSSLMANIVCFNFTVLCMPATHEHLTANHYILKNKQKISEMMRIANSGKKLKITKINKLIHTFSPLYIREVLQYSVHKTGFAAALPVLIQFFVKVRNSAKFFFREKESVLAQSLFQCATMVSRQYSPFVLANIQFIWCLSMLICPILVSFLLPTGSVDEWRLVFFSHSAVLVISNIIFCLLATAKPAPWTDPLIVTTARKTLLYSPSDSSFLS